MDVYSILNLLDLKYRMLFLRFVNLSDIIILSIDNIGNIHNFEECQQYQSFSEFLAAQDKERFSTSRFFK